jgi:farnesyl-diphosphate farnesyltransferase
MTKAHAQSMADMAYQHSILRAVSRTFALTIPLLPKGLETIIGNTYLLCRIIDTIEDAPTLRIEEKKVLSSLFLDAVLGKQAVTAFVTPCLLALETHCNVDERDLIANTPTVLRIFHGFTKDEQAVVSRCVEIMSNGMLRFHGKQTLMGLRDLPEFEEYCYVVAGVVGEMLTSVFAIHSPTFARAITGREYLAVSFGQALQMTNILKDSPEDSARGVSWKPQGYSQLALLAIADQKLADAMDYIRLIPSHEVGIRRFCFLALGLAVLTLSKIAERTQFETGNDVKLSRRTVWLFYYFTLLAAHSNYVMQQFCTIAGKPIKRALRD